MKYPLFIFIFFSGCAELQKVLNIASDVAPIVDTAFPGVGTILGGSLGIVGAITALIIAKKRKK